MGDDDPLGMGLSTYVLGGEKGGSAAVTVNCENDFMAALVGGFVCPGSLRLAKFALSSHFPSPLPPFAVSDSPVGVRVLDGCSVVDVGAGCGLLGMTLAKSAPKARVVMTDMSDVVDHLRNNVRANEDLQSHHVTPDNDEHKDAGFIMCRPLNWADEKDAMSLLGCMQVGSNGVKPVDFLFAGDCFYQHEAVPLLLRTMEFVCGEDTHAYISGVPCPSLDNSSGSVLETLLLQAPQSFEMHLVSLEYLNPHVDDNEKVPCKASCPILSLEELCAAAASSPNVTLDQLRAASCADTRVSLAQLRAQVSASSSSVVATPSSAASSAAAPAATSAAAPAPAAEQAKQAKLEEEAPASDEKQAQPAAGGYTSTAEKNIVFALCDAAGVEPTHLCQGIWLFKRKTQTQQAGSERPVPAWGSYAVVW